MKLDDDYDYDYDYEEHHGKLNLGMVVLIISFFMLCILLAVYFINRFEMNKRAEAIERMEASAEETAETFEDSDDDLSDQYLTPDSLDFWDMYPRDSESSERDVPGQDEKNDKEIPDNSKELKDETTITDDEEKDPMDDGKHTMVKYSDGGEEWVVISPYIPKNSYNFSKLVSDDNNFKYIEDGRRLSFLGTDISKYQEDVDFYQLKDAGIDFVMLRVGARGYGTGQIKIDDCFLNNIQKATEAGLDVGVYFFSQAITEEEAVEEANIVIQNLAGYEIRYPVAFDMEYIDNDTARVEAVSKADKTKIAKAFLETVKAAGYRPMIYGDKEWLLKRIDLSKLISYDVWLSQESDIPDFPYEFTMWQYSTSGKINGISGLADLNMCLIDYDAK